MKKQNSYILITNLYFNLDIKICTIAKMLFFEANPMNLDDKIPLPIINRLPSGITKFIRIFRLCNKLFLKKYFSKKEEVLTLEMFGHVLLKRQLNNISINKSVYKLFDFNKKEITSLYESNVLVEEMEQDVEKLNAVKSLNITPKLIEINYDEKYYVEEYLNLKHPIENQWPKTLKFVKYFIRELYNSFEIRTVYKEKLLQKTNIEVNEKLMKNILFSRDLEEIITYINDKKYYLKDIKEDYIKYAQSHGDLNRSNFFLDENRIIGIDWELLKYRPLYYDVFYFFLIVNRKDFNFFNKEKSDIEIKELINFLQDQCELEKSLNKEKIEMYLNCFILEYLDWKFRVYLTYKNSKDFKRRLSEIQKDIYYFEKFGREFVDIFK